MLIYRLRIWLEKIFDIYGWFKASFSSKHFQSFFSFAIVIFFLLSSVVVYGQDNAPVPTTLDTEVTYQGVQIAKEAAGFTDYSSLDNQGNQITSALLQVFAAAAPDALPNYEETMAKYGDDIPYSMQYGLIGVVDNLNISMLDNHPRVDVVAHLANEWVPGYDTGYASVYAQDSGYGLLQSINLVDLWNNIRMISYALFVVILIAAGFMIMFRQKIGGQMMVTVFNTLPKVIVGLFLVTFSFAIVGLLIDVGAVLIRVSAGILNVNDSPIVIGHPFSLVEVLFRGGSGTELRKITANTMLGGGAVGAILGGILAGPGGLLLGGIIAILVGLAVVGIIAFASVKVFVTLFKAYLGIIMDTVLAPLYLTFAVVPGKQSIGMDWFNRVLKNVLTFVGVFFVVNLAIYLRRANVNFAFPRSLAGGVVSQSPSGPVIDFLVQQIIPIFLFFMAAEVPNFLSDFLPTGGGKGAATGMQGVQKSLGKIPLIGSMFG